MAADLITIRDIAGRVAATHVWSWWSGAAGGGKARTLRITIDKPEGVSHEDCAIVSREVSTILDVEDAVPGAASYTLEVSSPGWTGSSPGAGFARFTGSRIKVTTREPVQGNRHFEGRWKVCRRPVHAGNHRARKPKPGHAPPAQKVEIELANVEKANVVRKFSTDRYRVTHKDSMASEIYNVIDALSREKGIDPQIVVSAVEDAIVAATRKKDKSQENLRAQLDKETGNDPRVRGQEHCAFRRRY